MGEPRIEIDPEQVEKLASLHCTVQEIADFFECSRDTIERRFRVQIQKGRASGKITLRRKQWQAAEKGNVSMLIWLGKNILGQKDKSDEEIEAMANQAGAVVPTAEMIAEAIKKARETKK